MKGYFLPTPCISFLYGTFEFNTLVLSSILQFLSHSLIIHPSWKLPSFSPSKQTKEWCLLSCSTSGSLLIGIMPQALWPLYQFLHHINRRHSYLVLKYILLYLKGLQYGPKKNFGCQRILSGGAAISHPPSLQIINYYVHCTVLY